MALQLTKREATLASNRTELESERRQLSELSLQLSKRAVDVEGQEAAVSALAAKVQAEQVRGGGAGAGLLGGKTIGGSGMHAAWLSPLVAPLHALAAPCFLTVFPALPHNTGFLYSHILPFSFPLCTSCTSSSCPYPRLSCALHTLHCQAALKAERKQAAQEAKALKAEAKAVRAEQAEVEKGKAEVERLRAVQQEREEALLAKEAEVKVRRGGGGGGDQGTGGGAQGGSCYWGRGMHWQLTGYPISGCTKMKHLGYLC